MTEAWHVGEEVSRPSLRFVVDTNVFLREWGRSSGGRSRFIEGLSGDKVDILLPRRVVLELQKKLDVDERGLMAIFKANGFLGLMRIVDDNRLEIVREAQWIPAHYPDNFVVAVAKAEQATLLTFDITMMQIARSIGVRARRPS